MPSPLPSDTFGDFGDFGARIATVWSELRPSTRGLVERALQAPVTGTQATRNFHYDARADLELSRFLAAIDTPQEADGDTIAVIRAHGVTPQVQHDLEQRAAKVIDATCPFVTRVQHLAERAARQGRDVVVAGNPDHPEMIGVVGYAPNNTYVVRDASEVANLPALRSPLVVSQTTIKLKTFLEVAEAVREKADTEPQVVNTICSATRDRQDAARALAGQVDAFYVIGGRHSSNSVKLLAVCQEQCAKSFLIETPAEINPADLENVKRVGVTAGASTPNWLIDQVVARLHELGA